MMAALGEAQHFAKDLQRIVGQRLVGADKPRPAPERRLPEVRHFWNADRVVVQRILRQQLFQLRPQCRFVPALCYRFQPFMVAFLVQQTQRVNSRLAAIARFIERQWD